MVSFRRNVLFLSLFACNASETVLSLICLSCTNVTSADLCKTTVDCSQGQGCRMLNSPGSYVAAVGKRSSNSTSDCSRCCNSERCNSNVCNTNLVNKTCEDDPTFDCARVNTLLNLCSNTDKAISVCRKFCGLCPVDGDWSQWGTWSQCSSTCGGSNTTRVRTCTNPAPANGGLRCTGMNLEWKDCGYKVPCPVHGSWSSWSAWGLCSVSCGIGLQRRDRQCSKPYPSYGGEHCFGDSRDDRPCFNKGCQDGGWSEWTSWSSCSQTCGAGMKRRHRQCDNPIPSAFGKDCDGDSTDFAVCTVNMCDGQWSTWGNMYCGYVHRRRAVDVDSRYINNKGIQSCIRRRTCSIAFDYTEHCYGPDEEYSFPTDCGCFDRNIIH